MSLDELLALHSPKPNEGLCGCGRRHDSQQEWLAHLSEVIRTSFVLLPRPVPVLGEPLVEVSNTGHLVFVAFPASDDLMDRVSADARILADEITKAFDE